MKYRVMAFDGTLKDFDTEAQARLLFEEKKKLVEASQITGIIAPSCRIHKCYHDETPVKSCEPIERAKAKKIQPERI